MRPFYRCPYQKASSARIAIVHTLKVGSGAPTAVTTRHACARKHRRAASCRRRFRSSSSVSAARAARSLHRHHSAVARSRNSVRSSSSSHNSNNRISSNGRKDNADGAGGGAAGVGAAGVRHSRNSRISRSKLPQSRAEARFRTPRRRKATRQPKSEGAFEDGGAVAVAAPARLTLRSSRASGVGRLGRGALRQQQSR